MAIDLLKAFDSICHNLLLAKLKAYGLQDSALQLMRSYLQDRKQRVKCNGVYSGWLPIRCGVPQGSLLGPLLFNIFVNDVNYTVENSSLRFYADDTIQYAHDTSSAILEYTLNQDICALSDWCKANYFHINSDKTQAMILGKSQYSYDLKVDNQMIKIKDTLKILGVTLDKELNFKPYIKDILRKVFAKIAALWRLKRMVPKESLIKLYKAYVLPHFEYCSPLLIGISKTLKNKLENANYYSLRTMMNLGRNVRYETVLNLATMRSLEHRRVEQPLIIFYACFKQFVATYISNFFKLPNTPHALRGSGHNVVQDVYNSCYLHNSYEYIISHIWNQLPLSAKSSTSLSEFRNQINQSDLLGCQCYACI